MATIGFRRSASTAWHDALTPFYTPFIVTITLGATASYGATASQLSFTGVPAVVLFTVAMFAGGVVWRRFGGSVLDSGGGWRGEAFLRAGEVFGLAALAILMALALGVLSYVAARTSVPFQDATLLRADALLGFHWTAWARFVEVRPLLHLVFWAAYQSFIPQIGVVLVALMFVPDRQRSVELFYLFAVVGAVTCFVSALLPAIDAGPYLTGIPAAWTYDQIAVHKAGAAVFTADRLEGIVSLPSFHAAGAVMLMWATRRTRAFGWVIAVLNSVMVVSVLSEGKHYLVDAIAGLAVAGAAIAVVHSVLYADDARLRR